VLECSDVDSCCVFHAGMSCTSTAAASNQNESVQTVYINSVGAIMSKSSGSMKTKTVQTPTASYYGKCYFAATEDFWHYNVCLVCSTSHGGAVD
jgi:hypothetical protein